LVTNSEGKDSSNITKVYGCRNVIAEGPEKVPYVNLMDGEDVGKVAPAAKVQYRELISTVELPPHSVMYSVGNLDELAFPGYSPRMNVNERPAFQL
jgi:hypothetical protein